ncbi:hypothetical protein AVEN_155415-1 [Araneus ventricosus]|uniref:Uncharacterized protein n=1 Tax=Araneus ventricosus TaxID=182803 RepID=A0A4Y2MPY2_ARAVE|nr:hypothetical protein AVEN_155415-1 [Araneus ventricosus]
MGSPSDCNLTLNYAKCLISISANVFYAFYSDMFQGLSFWFLELTRGFYFEMAAYIDKIRCFDCDATLLGFALFTPAENKPLKFRSISTASGGLARLPACPMASGPP